MGVAVMVIRPMTASDIAEVARLEAAHQPRPWSETVFEEELSAVDRAYFVAEAHGAVAGFAGVMVVGDEAHVMNLFVAPSQRMRGLARRLVLEVVDAALSMGARHLTLEVRVGNEAARRLYAGFGMAPVGSRPGYYGDEDALILWAHDIDSPEYRRMLAGLMDDGGSS